MYQFTSPVLKQAFTELKETIPHSNWFIAGGSLASTTFNDVDVYFLTLADFQSAEAIFDTNTTSFYIAHKSPNSTTYLLRGLLGVSVQLICKSVGPIEEVISNFDLNKSQIALTPNLELITSPIYDAPLHFIYSNMSSDTLDRMVKYIEEKGFDTNFDQQLLAYADYVVSNPNITLPASYANDLELSPVAVLLRSLTYTSHVTSQETVDTISATIKSTYPELYV